MSDLQNDTLYKSCMKNLAVYSAGIVKLYNNEDGEREDIINYQSALIEIYPVIENLALELNTFYGAHLDIPKIGFESAVEKIDALIPLLSAVKQELKTNENFAACSSLFDFGSPHLSTEIKNTLSYLDHLGSHDEANKAMYWFYNNVQLFDSYFSHLYNQETDRLWTALTQTKLGEALAAARFKEKNAADIDNEELANTLMNTICDVGIKYMEARMDEQDFDVRNEIIKQLQAYNIKIADAGFNQTLTRQLPEIINLYQQHEEGFRRLENINTALDDINDYIWDYDDEEITAAILEYAAAPEELISINKVEDIKLSQKDVDNFVSDYEDYRNLRCDTIEEFNDYLNNKEACDRYKKTGIDDEILQKMLIVKIKSWLVDLSRDSKKIIPPLVDLGNGRSRFGNKREYASFIHETLDLACDIISAGRAVAVYIPVPDRNGEPVHIDLNSGDIGERYIQKLMNNSNKLTLKDYQTLAVLINTFEYNYNHYRPSLGFDRQEARSLKDFNNQAYLNRLLACPDCIDKMNIAQISSRIFRKSANNVLNEISEQREIFNKEVSGMHPEERESLIDYIKSGAEIYPDLDVDKVLSAVDNIVTPLVLIPIYDYKEYSENNFRLGMEYTVKSSNLPEIQQSFIKSAANGYKKSLVAKHLKISAAGQHSTLHYMARNYGGLMRKQYELTEAKEQMEAVFENQCEIYEKYRRISEYEANGHPGKDYINALLLNSKINKR